MFRYGHIALTCPTKRTMILKKSDDVDSEHPSPHSPSREESSSSSKTKTCEGVSMLVRHMIDQVQSEVSQLKDKTFFKQDASLISGFAL